jgi:DNA-binding beta-propeller fold protein YncE
MVGWLQGTAVGRGIRLGAGVGDHGGGTRMRSVVACSEDAVGGVPRRSAREFIGILALALGLLALAAPSALAARGHQFTRNIGAPCAVGPCAPGTLSEPSAVAVNEATEVIYVLDQGNERVQRFASDGTFLGGFDGGPEFEESPGVNVPTTEAGHGGNSGELETGPFSFGAAPQVSGIAVDNSCSLEGLVGAACEDPSNEDVYVVDPGHNVVDKFKPDGEYIGQITEAAGAPLHELGGVATAPSGTLWIYQEFEAAERHENGAFYRFTNDANVYEGEIPRPAIAPFVAPGVAVGADGSFYSRAGSGSHFLVEKRDHSGIQLIAALDNENSSGIAVDLKTDNSFLDNVTTIASFRPDGTELERLGNEGGAHHLAQGAGLAADAASEAIYVADAGAGQVVVFGPQQPKAPEIVTEGVQDISSAAARLEAEINPRSETGDTSYRFQYGPCTGTLPSCTTNAFPFETPTAALAPDFEIHPVAALITGLQPGTPYHFRLFAENGQGETTGPEETFTTQSVGGSLLLPDSRQWQLVSPPDKLGALIAPITEEDGVNQASTDGRAFSYVANAPIEANPQGFYPGGAQILSTRGASGWASENLAAPHDVATGPPTEANNEWRFFTEDLSTSFLQPFGTFTPSISPEATEQSAFERTDFLGGDPGRLCKPATMDCYRPLVTGAPGFANVPAGTVFGEPRSCPPRPICGPRFKDATPDGSHVVLGGAMGEGTERPVEQLYEWDAASNRLQLVSLLPGGGRAFEPKLGSRNGDTRHAISDDGSRIVFEEPEPTNNAVPLALYLRDSARDETVQLDVSEPLCEAAGECESGGGRFQLASSDDSRILFTDPHRLTADSGAGVGGNQRPDLYECRIVVDAAGDDQCRLTDLTPETGGESADVQGFLPGASEDATNVYFVANGVLTTEPDGDGEVARPGHCSAGTSTGGATCNLYLRHDGETRLVAVLAAGDAHDWALNLAWMPARVSPDGRWLAFMSQRSLTGYDNRDRATGSPVAEVYLYDAATDRLACASCDPTGARPVGVEYGKLEFQTGALVGGYHSWEPGALVAANVPGWTSVAEAGQASRHQPRYLSNSGRLFFNTVNPLVPQDANGTQDVYQYEPPGFGTCTPSSPTYGELSEGCVSLISSGTSAQESAFLDASESGDDVFFLTSARLSGSDTDSARDVYDAHVCTAQVPCLPEPQPPAPACSGDACQQPATSPNDATPGSLTFNGAGNVKECPKRKQLKKGKCVKKKQAKKKGKNHTKKHHKKKSNKANGKSKRTPGKSQGDNK